MLSSLSECPCDRVSALSLDARLILRFWPGEPYDIESRRRKGG